MKVETEKSKFCQVQQQGCILPYSNGRAETLYVLDNSEDGC